MASYNKVVLMGNVARNPELRHSAGSNLPVARTAIAVNHKYKDKEEVMFIDIIAFGKQAETLETYVTKGTPLLVDGRLSQSKWEQDGVIRSKHEIIVEKFQLLGGRRERPEDGGMHDAGGSSGGFNPPSDETDEDEIPF